jgi:hypothetical protein
MIYIDDVPRFPEIGELCTGTLCKNQNLAFSSFFLKMSILRSQAHSNHPKIGRKISQKSPKLA